MKHRLVSTGLGVLLLLLPFAAGAANPDRGLREYTAHEFDNAIKSCEGGKDFLSKLITGLCYEEKSCLYKTKFDKDQAVAYFKVLSISVKMENAGDLEKVLAIEGNTWGNRAASKILNQALKSALTPDQLLQASRFVDPKMGVEVNRIALSSLYKRLKTIRYYVTKGGSMPEKERKLFANPAFIQTFVRALAEKKTAGAARGCLIQIEEPALVELEKVELTRPLSDTIVAIKKAIEVRKKRFPDSTWFGAAGS
ncbi:MAG: hypothetical protein V2A34_00355 [Lentisphaerota bacterium]